MHVAYLVLSDYPELSVMDRVKGSTLKIAQSIHPLYVLTYTAGTYAVCISRAIVVPLNAATWQKQ